MSEQFPQEPIHPETVFHLAQVGQKLVTETLVHTDPVVLRELESEQRSTISYNSLNKCFGDLSEWDGRFFSYTKKNMEQPNPNDNSLTFDIHPEDGGHAPEGTSLFIEFKAGGIAAEGEVFVSTVAIRTEAPPLVEEWVGDHQRGNNIRIEAWRELSEQEGGDLLADLAELRGQLANYMEANPGVVLFSDSDYPDDF